MTASSDHASFNRRIIDEFRANDGKVGGLFEGAPMVLVHHIGARSGMERINPLVYLPDDDRIVVFASKGGAPTNPDWYHNLMAHPRVLVEIATRSGVETATVEAVEVTGTERDELFARQVEARPAFGDYEQRAAGVRTIPVVALIRIS